MLEQRFSDNEASKRDVCSFIEPRPPLISNPFMRPRPQKGTNLLELFEDDSECEEQELVQVYLRMKPCNVPSNLYEVRSDRCLITSLDTTTAGHGRRTQHNVSKMYTFSHIFGSQASQKEIFETVVKENLRKLPEGHSFTLLTYGASGSGKTYTLMGTVASPGLVPRSLEYVFRVVDAAQQPLYKPAEGGADKLSYSAQDYELQWVKRLRQVSAPLREKYRRMSAQLCNDMTASTLDLSNRTRHYVWVSFVEIYNEGIYDLLSTSDRRASSKLVIREDSNGNVYVKGATQAFVRTGVEAYDVMVAGKHNLQVAATGVHAQSSRSHCIFTITMLTETDSGVRVSCVRLCDLAGCERARRTRNTGERMRESRAINSSLHVLERCLHTLRRRQRGPAATSLVPYRESKLTRLLGAGLSGARGEAVAMVVTLNPAPELAHETRHVLQLAAVARDIQINNTISDYPSTLESSQDTIVSSSGEVMRLRAENERLHFELVQAQARNKELLASMEERQAATADTMRELVEEAKAIERQFYEAQMQALRTEMEDMAEEYESRLSKIAVAKASETPSKSLQKKITQLMTDLAIVEEKLNAEKLARARAEEEVQHLRACIEERDEKSDVENAIAANEDVMSVTDSDDSEDDEDPCNESLEPTFKKEDINRSRLIRQSIAREQHSFNESDQSDNNCDVSILERSQDTIKDNDATRSLDNTYESNSVKDDRTCSLDDTQKSNNNEDDRAGSLDDTYATGKESQDSKDRDIESRVQELHVKAAIKTDSLDLVDDNDSLVKDMSVYSEKSDSKMNSFDDAKNVVPNDALTSGNKFCRGTYFVSESNLESSSVKSQTTSVKETVSDEQKETFEKNDNVSKFFDDAEEMDEVNQLEIPRMASDTLVSKIINSLKSTKGSNNSLAQFEQLEKAAKDCKSDCKEQDEFCNIKMLKEKRTYFEEITNEIKTGNKESRNDILAIVTESSKPIERKTYFDNIGVNLDKAVDKRLTQVVGNVVKDDDLRSPSIVKEEVTGDFEPSTIKRLLGESITRQPDPVSILKKNVLIKKHDSIDVFEGLDSPLPIIAKAEVENVEIVRKSIENIVLHEDIEVNNVIPVIKVEQPSMEDKLSKQSSVEQNDDNSMPNDKTQEIQPVEEKTHAIKSPKEESLLSSNISKAYVSNASIATDNTIDEFENIYKDITAPNVTEFELLVSQEIPETQVNDTVQVSETQVNDTVQVPVVEEVKYNLRHKSIKQDKKANDDTKTKNKKDMEVLLESEAKCESKTTLTKRHLRLKRRKNMTDDEISELDKGEKLKDIVNLQCEFSDVTIDVPALVKHLKDIPSPEKVETENLPPHMGIQSCPSKSVTRSRRKLFTPRAEPLEESFSQTGESNERVYVPRPSYHRPRARRKL